ncbi:MAG: hypothetical protein KDI38_09410 [Calditrichaeota bacterium]|nr:hypothetical protein [Calditrichota bacterium]
MKQDSFAIPTNDFPIGWSVYPIPKKPDEPQTYAVCYKRVVSKPFKSEKAAFVFLCNQMAQVIASQEDEIAEISGEQPFDPDNCAIPAMNNFWQEKISKGAANGKAD